MCRPGGRVVVVSNTKERGLFGNVKTALSPIMERVGFSTDLDVESVMGESGLRVVDTRRVNLGIHMLIVSEPS